MEFTIRPLTQEDLRDDSGFYDTLESLSQVRPISAEKAREIFARTAAHTVVLVAVCDGHIVGTTTVFFEPMFIHGGSLVAHIHNVATRKGFEGQGIGRALIAHAVTHAQARSCYKVNLECSEQNVPFYEKCGFHRHEIAMRRDLPR